MRTFSRWRLEKRYQGSRFWQVASIPLAILIAFLVSSIFIRLAAANVFTAFSALLGGAFGGRNAISESLIKATPLIFTGLAVTVAFRGKVWNIGADGQLIVGAIAAFWIAKEFSSLPKPVILLGMLVMSFLAGAIWGALPGLLRGRLGINEIVLTVMMNYVALYLLSFLISGPWQDPNSYYLRTPQILETSYLPVVIPGYRLHWGFILALILAVLVHVVMWKTPLGYEIRAVGVNAEAARRHGIEITRTFFLIMVISGGISGLAGASQLAGFEHRLRLTLSLGYGFTGIIIALLGNLNPFGVIASAIFFGALVNGATAMQILSGIPDSLVYAIQGTILLIFLLTRLLIFYRIKRLPGAF